MNNQELPPIELSQSPDLPKESLLNKSYQISRNSENILSRNTQKQNELSYLVANRQKQSIEANENLLANRIMMLDNEQSKILKRIENTRRRAEQIAEVRKINEQRNKSLMENNAKQIEEYQERQKRVLAERKQRQQINDFLRQSKQAELKAKGQETYMERQFYTQLKYELKNEEIINKQMKKIQIQEAEKRQLLQNQIEREKKQIENRNYYDDRVQNIEYILQAKQNQLKKLEQLETRMLNKLQETQQKESEAFNTLQKNISLSVLSQKARLDQKLQKNKEIRESYRKPVSLAHLEPVLKSIQDNPAMQYIQAHNPKKPTY